ncbi:lipid A deacylase LpxR family protein [Salinicola aestuarinus]|uniref:lipid A deacylase LpxR family protein n=1 Tax=Salinicola aestuarinus TaxID=1949082 RepID=UPI001CB6E6C1|nr:lipid A deacylase LpxR family protein [Salinicola aestuarinus]
MMQELGLPGARLTVSRAGLGLTLVLLAGSANADGILTLKTDNDIFASGGDGHYTNGFEADWTFEPAQDHWTRAVADLVPGWSRDSLTATSYRFGQQIYTPEDIDVSEPIEDDRPYAGVLYAGMTLFSDEQLNDWRHTSGVYLDAGLIGPGAGGEFVQKNFHHLVDSEEPEGWHNQLHNEPFLNVAYRKAWWKKGRLDNLEAEYGPSAGFAAGNLYTYVAAGLGARLGQGLDNSFGIPAVAPSNGSRVFFDNHSGFNWYLFANLEGRRMFQNLLLDGNSFEDSQSVDRRHWVGDVQAGLALSWNRWQITYSALWRTHEFDGQETADRFGSLTLSTWL